MEIEVKGQKIKLKKDYLTNGEVNYIVVNVLELYNTSDDIKDYSFSPLSMYTNFYSLLFELCIEDYIQGDADSYNKYYNLGAQYELMKIVVNAQEAYNILIDTANKMSSVAGVLDKGITNIVKFLNEKIPDQKTMMKLANKLPKEWQKAVNEYNNITGNDKNEDK